MPGNNGEKKQRVIPKIIWKKCDICKCRKKEEDMAGGEWCNDCFRKQSQSKNSFVMKNLKHPSKFGTERAKRQQ